MSEISGEKIRALVLLDKGPVSVPAHLVFQACKCYIEARWLLHSDGELAGQSSASAGRVSVTAAHVLLPT